ncbi:N-acetylmuramoyl-L-alanine amidase [Neptunomonas qingdaonensis]|uniref:N-acetylmuramoyl-L-alanine amidase AmiC n=1 Tax=Neptunomonas qingdaonensis TaxID=1045558 RepID=A0A1I2UB43_9GAMM|nr:N-acetylmuramoyl-L-alanine amidase [Neptunomonas qingdaonensis]SFG74223.1 N-acetylmuramoyl-L-alanine amidase [Neptunomonas qingdaonensis]
MMKNLRKFTGCFLTIACLLVAGHVSAADIKNVRMWLAPDNTRLVFDLNGPVTHKIFSLNNPDRLVLDINGAAIKTRLSKLDLKGSPIKQVRSSMNGNNLRIVLDLNQMIRPRSFDLKPNDQYGHRLVLDLFNLEKETVVKTATPERKGAQLRDIIIAIDAGHGGEDPGAIGAGRVREKDVVLGIAKEVGRLIDNEKGFKAELVREGDYYISLRGRTKEARKKNADLFVSIHADAFKDSRARGASVWVLSNRGATSEVGRWLAQKENSADLIGGVGSVSLEDKDDVLAGVLLDMSMTASRSDSLQIASKIHGNVNKFAKMHKSRVESAGFMVLKSPDIPSILVETGFISNPEEARLLKTKAYQQKMAKAIYEGIKSHFWNKPPAYTYVAYEKNGGDKQSVQRHYQVVSGDTLSVIASRHGIALNVLRKTNDLKGDKIRIGQVLRIPTS